LHVAVRIDVEENELLAFNQLLPKLVDDGANLDRQIDR